MKITRLTTPTFSAVSTAELEAWLRIDTGQDADSLSMLVGSATDVVEGITGLVLGRATYRLDLDGIDNLYRLPIDPLHAVTKVECHHRDGTVETITGWSAQRGYLHLATSPTSFLTVSVEAGYDDPHSVPDGLRHAIAVLVSAGYDAREEISPATMLTVERLCHRHRRFWL